MFLLTKIKLNPFVSLVKSLRVRALSVVSYDNNQITVHFNGGSADPVSFQTIFLRDACDSSESVDISSRQKNFSTAQIAQNLRVAEPPTISHVDKVPHLEVLWKHKDDSVSRSLYSEAQLKKYSTFQDRMRGKFFPHDQVFWNKSALIKEMKSLNVDYFAYMSGTETFKNVVNSLNRFGLCFVNDIEDPFRNPQTQELSAANLALWPVAKLASKFGYIKETFYGKLFNVKSEPNAKNIANTDVFLPLHMDLCYYESPPGLQLLHFIQNSTTGGENVFADSFLAAQHIRESDPEAYEALKTVPITFHYDNADEYYYYLRPLIVEDPYVKTSSGESQIKEVNYSPPFQGPFEFYVTSDDNPHLYNSFIRGMVSFEKFVNDPTNQYVVKIPENSCVIFDNRRVLHSRLKFSTDNGGERWLMGCYVDGDSFRSKLRYYNRIQ